MSNQPHWKAPLFINLDDLEEKVSPEKPAPQAQEFPLASVSVTSEQDESIQTERLMHPVTKPNRWKKLFRSSVVILLSAAVISEVYRLVSWGLSIHPTLGVIFIALSGITAISGLFWIWQGFKGLRQLKQTEALHVEADALRHQKTHGQAVPLLKKLGSYYANTPVNKPLKEALQQLDTAYNDGEIIRYISKHALKEQDEAARRCVHRYSVQSGVLVALSPYATFDMWLVGWRNLKMLREITDIYGISPGAATQWNLLKKVLHNIAFAGLSEMTIHAGSHVLGGSLTSTVSARAGQGVGAGLFTARSGLQAIRLCRPLPQEKSEQLQLSSVSQSILSDLKQ